jgi:putative ABC transport system permease protein
MWIARLFRRRRLERQLAAELQDHIERETTARRSQGLNEGEARRQARLALGGVEQVKEQCRDERRPRLLAELAQDLRFTLRTLRRQPLVGSAIVLVIGLAIGANAAIFSVVDAVALKPLALPNPDQLAMLWKGPLGGEPVNGVAPANALELEARLRTAAAAPMTMTWLVLRTPLDSERIAAMRVSPGFFRTVGVLPSPGRGFLDSEDTFGAEPVAVISHALWQRRFGGAADVIGRSLETSDARYRIVGVMPHDFRFPAPFGAAFRPEVWTPLQFSRDEAAARGAGYMFLLLRRAADRPWSIVQQELDAISREYVKLEPRVYGGQHLRAMPLQEQVVGTLRPVLFSLWAAVGCVLLMACANVANLLLSRATVRQRELALRASLGASRMRLLRQLLTESLVLSMLASAAGLALALVLVRVGAASLGDALPRADEIAIDLRVAIFTAGMAIVTSLLVGTLPALQLSSLGPQDALRTASYGHTSALWSSLARRTLLVAQITIAVFLTACAGLLVRSFAAVQRVDLGFQPQGLFSFAVSLPDADYDGDQAVAFYERLTDRLEQLPQVTSAGAVSTLPLSGDDFSWTFEVRDKPTPPGASLEKADVRFVTPRALPAMGVTLRKGRGFEPTDRRDGEPVTIVSETFARRTWPGADPLDKYVKLAGPLSYVPWMRVVGVVADVHLEAADRPPAPTIYRPHTQHRWKGMGMVVRTTGPTAAAAPAIRAVVQSIDPRAAMLDPRDFSYYVAKSVAQRRLVTLLIAAFATVATTLALVGVYALFAYVIALRTREIGIRLTLGARGPQVVWMVMRQALALTTLGLGLGVAAALGARRVLEAHLFGVSAGDAPTLAGVAVGVLLAACLASYLPARRAAAVELTTALRLE